MKEYNPYFLYVGSAYPHKNLERAIKAAVNLKTDFYIVSSRNVFTNRLEKLVKKLKAEKYVKLLGFVSDEKLQELYKNSVGFIYPSLSEGFGLPGLEAMNAGALVLASEIPVFKEIYTNHALYFNQLDFSSIEKIMKAAIEMNPNERKNKILEGQKFVKKYSWAKMAKETLDIYAEAIKKESSDSLRSGK